MKIAVVYTSKYGTTQQYAQWIAKDVGADLLRQDACKVKDLEKYECLVFGGPIHAGGILGIRFLQKNYKKLSDKKIFVFAVGLNIEDPAVQQECREINFVKTIKDLPCYFLRGGYDPSKVTGMDKRLMGIVKKMIAGKGEMTESERELLDAIEQGADYTSYSATYDLVYAIQTLQLETKSW